METATMTELTRANLVALLWSGHCPAGSVVPDLILHGYQDRHFDWPAWALGVLLATEDHDDGLERTEVIYRACGRCLESTGMAALVFGHACRGEPSLPRWVKETLWAVA